MVGMLRWSLGCLFVLGSLAGCSSPGRSGGVVASTAPMLELSGLAIWELDGREWLLAVGDESYELLMAPLTEGGGPDWGAARRLALAIPKQAGGSELEGVMVDAKGRVVVVAERGEVFAFEPTADRTGLTLVERRAIVFGASHPLAEAWRADPNSRAEGIAEVGGRLFIVKQRDPAALVELEARGDELVAAGHWALSGLDDASELVASGGRLVIVGARSNLICEVAVPAGASTGPLPCLTTRALPERLGDEGKARWEGLAVRRDGTLILAVDTKKADRPNIAVMAPEPRR